MSSSDLTAVTNKKRQAVEFNDDATGSDMKLQKRGHASTGTAQSVTAKADKRCCNILDSGEVCDSPNIDSMLFDKFGAEVCSLCRSNYPERYKLVTQTEVLSKHLLNPRHISDLKYVLKENPMNRHYTSMKLFLQSQVDEVVLTVWKSVELLEAEIAKRQEAKYKLELQKVEGNVPVSKKQKQRNDRKRFLADVLSSVRNT